jgi:periplasmic divalent cation tolerance protein
MAPGISVLATTLPGTWTEAEVGSFAQSLISPDLAACIQIDSIRSVYRWDGEICSEKEWRLQLKTSSINVKSLEAAILAAHPYEVPQILIWNVDASAGYLEWVQERENA